MCFLTSHWRGRMPGLFIKNVSGCRGLGIGTLLCRICTICKERNLLVMGDEEHALTSCVGFENQRNRLFRYFEEKYPSFK